MRTLRRRIERLEDKGLTDDRVPMLVIMDGMTDADVDRWFEENAERIDRHIARYGSYIGIDFRLGDHDDE